MTTLAMTTIKEYFGNAYEYIEHNKKISHRNGMMSATVMNFGCINFYPLH